MKKILSLILACVLCISAISITTFADAQANDNLFGVIIDADGNVVEVLTMPRTTYLNKVYTIPAGGSLISYQYEPTKNFLFGFDTQDCDGNYITAPYCKFDVTIQISNTIGADNKTDWATRSVITGSKDDIGKGISINFNAANSRIYCNGKLTNGSLVSTNVRLIVLMNYDNDELFDIYNV